METEMTGDRRSPKRKTKLGGSHEPHEWVQWLLENSPELGQESASQLALFLQGYVAASVELISATEKVAKQADVWKELRPIVRTASSFWKLAPATVFDPTLLIVAKSAYRSIRLFEGIACRLPSQRYDSLQFSLHGLNAAMTNLLGNEITLPLDAEIDIGFTRPPIMAAIATLRGGTIGLSAANKWQRVLRVDSSDVRVAASAEVRDVLSRKTSLTVGLASRFTRRQTTHGFKTSAFESASEEGFSGSGGGSAGLLGRLTGAGNPGFGPPDLPRSFYARLEAPPEAVIEEAFEVVVGTAEYPSDNGVEPMRRPASAGPTPPSVRWIIKQCRNCAPSTRVESSRSTTPRWPPIHYKTPTGF